MENSFKKYTDVNKEAPSAIRDVSNHIIVTFFRRRDQIPGVCPQQLVLSSNSKSLQTPWPTNHNLY
jgi:hypothetical protein